MSRIKDAAIMLGTILLSAVLLERIRSTFDVQSCLASGFISMLFAMFIIVPVVIYIGKRTNNYNDWEE